MNFITKAIQESEDHQSLKLKLHKYLSRYEPARSLSVLHASEVTKSSFCGRRNAIMLATGTKPKDEYLTTSLAVTYEIGKLLQTRFVQWMADLGIAVGDWRCTHCGRASKFCKRPVVCDKCGGTRFDPEEVRVTSLISNISGGLDMIASTGKEKLRLVEIKTVESEAYKKIVAPLAEHKLRTALYLRLIAESADPLSSRIDDQFATVVYISKGGYGTVDAKLTMQGSTDKFSPFKEYSVGRDDALTDGILAQPTQLTEWRRGLGGMPKKKCSKETDPLAVGCPVRQYCFGQVFPEGALNPNPVVDSACL